MEMIHEIKNDPVTVARIAVKNLASLVSPEYEKIMTEKIEKAFQYIKQGGNV